MQISNHVRSAHFEAPADIPPLKSCAHPWLRLSPHAGSLPPLKVGIPPGSAQNWSTASIMQHFVSNSAEFCDEYIHLSFVPHSAFFFFFFVASKEKCGMTVYTQPQPVIGRLCQKCACQARHHFLTENLV